MTVTSTPQPPTVTAGMHNQIKLHMYNKFHETIIIAIASTLAGAMGGSVGVIWL